MLNEWLHFALRWFHLIAGISWIGNSFYFMWLDGHLSKPSPGKDPKKIEGELWMVHSGGFYQVEKRKIQPNEMPAVLHWFKWEATFTWLTGFGLLSQLFYANAGLYLIHPQALWLTPWLASFLGVLMLAGSWLIYDLIWLSPLAKGDTAIKTPATWVSLSLLSALIVGYSQFFSGRGLYIHLGALLGTIMVLNVWIRILPAQTKMVAATRAGVLPDFELGKKAKKRSVHNSYVTLPVLLVMMCNHFPMTYESPNKLLILGLLMVLGMTFRHLMIVGLKKSISNTFLLIFSVIGLVFITLPKTSSLPLGSTPRVKFDQVQAILISRCFSCHSESPSDKIYLTPPLGLKFDQPRSVQAYAGRIKNQVVVQKSMPLNNQTQMTDDERTLLGTWIDEGANIP